MKTNFITPFVKAGLHVITKMRPDANLQYLYKSPQRKGRGRKRKVGGKVNVKSIDTRKLKKCYSDQTLTDNELIVWCVTLKAAVKVVYLQSKQGNWYEILLSTDTAQKAKQIIQYYNYRLRFQI
jgi:phosphotransferase system HPr-like phosphotransfer protein